MHSLNISAYAYFWVYTVVFLGSSWVWFSTRLRLKEKWHIAYPFNLTYPIAKKWTPPLQERISHIMAKIKCCEALQKFWSKQSVHLGISMSIYRGLMGSDHEVWFYNHIMSWGGYPVQCTSFLSIQLACIFLGSLWVGYIEICVDLF